jgi:hypothetical protein
VSQLASQYREIFEALLSAYRDIGTALPRFDRYEKAFKENPEFQNVLATVYSGILEFHQRAYKFFQRRGMNTLNIFVLSTSALPTNLISLAYFIHFSLERLRKPILQHYRQLAKAEGFCGS